jgi:hypothetical protein
MRARHRLSSSLRSMVVKWCLARKSKPNCCTAHLQEWLPHPAYALAGLLRIAAAAVYLQMECHRYHIAHNADSGGTCNAPNITWPPISPPSRPRKRSYIDLKHWQPSQSSATLSSHDNHVTQTFGCQHAEVFANVPHGDANMKRKEGHAAKEAVWKGHDAPVTANIFSAPVGNARATPREANTMKQVSSRCRRAQKGASSPANSTSSVYLHDICKTYTRQNVSTPLYPTHLTH